MDQWPEVVEYHRTLLADRVRTSSYQRALLATVRPGDVVLDVGTGTGLLACLAARAGARRVYAIESDDVIDVARPICRQNGLDEVVVFLNERAERVELPEKVDVVVTETMGNFGVDEGLLGIGIDVRTRLLRQGGRMIPRALELFGVPVELPDLYGRRVDGWTDEVCGLDVSPLRAIAVNAVQTTTLDPDAFLAEPAVLAQATLLETGKAEMHGTVQWSARRSGTLHRFGGWFAAELVEGLWLSNAPPLATPSWRHAFLPLERPVTVTAGDSVSLTVSVLGNGTLWNWRATVRGRAAGDQSTLWGVPHLRQRLHRVSSGHVPALTREGQAERELLCRVDGRTPIGALAEGLRQSYPEFFRSGADATAFVQDVLARCAR
jgi:protein arginine N-methyltransferase 1